MSDPLRAAGAQRWARTSCSRPVALPTAPLPSRLRVATIIQTLHCKGLLVSAAVIRSLQCRFTIEAGARRTISARRAAL
jgi:hypothetical protein